MPPVPFKIQVPQAKVERTKQKLDMAEFPEELDDTPWETGVPLSEVKRLVEAWRKWDWRIAEERLNQIPHFITKIDVDGFGALDIHFVHQKSTVARAIPLLFVHGWPGSFVEVIDLLPLLADSKRSLTDPAFNIVAPSLPNYGFSQGVSRRGFAQNQYAEVCHKLMLQLGYDEYVTQGGDWGFTFTRFIGLLYPEHCKASHVNLVRADAPTWRQHPWLALKHALKPYTAQEKAGLDRTAWFRREGRGYYDIQTTRPQTLAYSLHDSPVGLLAWIYEKLHDWTDNYPWTDDQLLTWISIFQFSTAGPGAAHRTYYEVSHSPSKGLEMFGWVPKVPLGLTYNPKDVCVVPDTWGRTLGPVVFEVHNDRSGHFYATEAPGLLARDVKTMFGKGGGAYGVVKDRDGY